MKYLTVFLVIVLLQLMVVDETMAQRSRGNTGKTGMKVPALTDLEFSSEIGYKKFWDKKSQGFSVSFNGDVVYYLTSTIGLGAVGYIAGGGGSYNDGSYNEPSTSWGAGIKSKLRTSTSFYSLSVGYFQISKDGQIASGLKDVVFSDGLFGKLEYQTYGRRLAQKTWLPAVGIYFEGKKAIKQETPAWLGNYSINYDLAPEIVKGAGEITIVDIKMGDLIIPFGLTGAVSMYDFKDSKVFYEVGAWLNPAYANNNVAKFYFGYQNGVTGIKGINRFVISASLDLSFLIKINQVNSMQPNNNRRRTR